MQMQYFSESFMPCHYPRKRRMQMQTFSHVCVDIVEDTNTDE